MGAIMITRALVLALWCACATALAPLATAGDDDCALYLNGPGRTSAYDYSLNLLKGNFGYEGQNTCITYDAVNQAYHDARQRIVVSQPKGEWKPEDYASVGELVLDVSINLARMYGLTYEEIEKGLPLIDTSRTLIREVCPPVFSHVECRAGKYRRLDGLCNNLQHPTWGATNAPFQRLIGPLFADGINAPRISHTGHDLPLSRVVSRTMHPDDGFHDHAGTVMVIAWGQFMDHDYTLTGTPLDPRSRNDPEECCKRPPHLKHPYCNEIRVPDDDYFYRLFNVKCIDFVRAFPSPRPGCRLGSRVPFNTLTGALDGNTVYGVTDKFARKLRTGYGGLLRMNPVFKDYGLKDLLPLKLDIPDEGCTRPNKNMYCFEAGEIRVNEQLVLTVMHTLMAREHNRVAGALASVNPHWDDETLYQEARRINIAEIQHITYNEFLPILLGKDVMEKFGLVVEKEGYWDGYDPHVNADVIDAFAAAAYRFGHSLLPTAVERWSKAHKFIASKRLSDLIRRPYDLYRAGVLDEYVMGLMNQVAQAMDDSITQEVTNHLFKKVGARFGMDLVSFNMQRGREFGLPGYMEFRKFCGLSGADSFQDLFGTMSNDTVRKYETIFSHPVDVDLWSGGVSERPLPGSMLGPTFACVIATQFSYSRRGDRFWYELPNQPSSFTAPQLAELRKARLARVICDNTDIIDSVQLYPMVLPDHELNPRVPCRSGILPSIDFTKWAEPAPFHSAKQFITEAVISVQNDTQCDDITEKIEKNNAEPCNNDTALEKGCECNETVVSSTAQNPETTLQNNKLNLVAHNSTDSTNENDTKFTQENTYNAKNHDAILKISKNDKVTNMHNKTNGHPKNSLRKKRSLNHNEDARYAESVPLIVNYKTSHSDEERDKPFERIRNVIKNSDLADFNIETLHENSQPKNKQNVKLQHKTNYILPKVQHEKSESNEDDNREGYIRNSGDERSYNSKVSSEERDQYNDDNKKPEHETEIHSYRENKDSIKNKQKPQYDRNESSRESDDSRENNEESRYTQRDNSNKEKEDSAENSREPEYENNKDSYREREDSVENEREPRYKENANTSYKDTDDSRETKDINTNSNYRDSEERKGKEDYRNTNNNYRDNEEIKGKEDYRNTNNNYRDNEERKGKEDYRNTNNNYRDSEERKGKEDYRNTNSNYRDSEERKGKDDYRNTNNNYRDNEERKGTEDRNTNNNYRDSEERKGKEDYRNTNSNYRDSEERKGKEDYVDDKENISRENVNNVNENDDNNRKLPYPDERDYSNKESQESNERDYYKKAPKLVNNKESYNDLPKQYSPNSESHENKQSEESNYPRNDFPRNRKESYSGSPKQSQDTYENESNKGSSSVESQEYDKSVDKKSPYTQSNTDSKETKDSIENDSSEQRQPSTNSDSVEDKYSGEVNLHLKKNPPNSYPKDNNDDEEEEAIIAIMKKKRPQVHNDHDELNTRNDQFKPIKISYETNHGNNKGLVAPVEVGPITHENYDTDSQVEIAPTATPIPIQLKEEIEQFSRSIESIEEPINSDVNSKIPININDGDIRPVVEINSDNSEESQENSKEAFKTNPDKQDTSLERLLGVKFTDNDDKNEKIVEGKNKENVKQEFERIPLNYNHDKIQQSDDNERGLTVKEDHSTTEPENNAEEHNDEGTVDTFVPENQNYDEKLNIKFDDIAIKLPEIKLPADILNYAYEEPSYNNRKYKKKPKFYQYSDENVDEDTPKNNNYKNKKEKNDEDDEDDEHDEKGDELHHSYPGYYSNDERKNEYRKNEKTTEEDEDVDLYEKFVRERFGKRGSFEKRSEKLQNAPTSPVEADEQLYSTLQQVLKKTEDLKQQAEKSGDPNAGFMWTLEYGKKLR